MNSEIESNKSQQGPILVAADFSENSMTAVLWAIDLANALNTNLVLIHIVHDRAEGPGYYKHDSIDAMRPMEDVAEKMMQQFIQKLNQKSSSFKSFSNLETRIVTGLPVSRILETADNLGAKMIVMGSQGLTGLKHLLIGSKAEQVVRLAKIPVTIVKN
tara:strand:+ start:645 stop:1121 length:477 start_codon:yes stop_codon:yes gene_type:complete